MQFTTSTIACIVVLLGVAFFTVLGTGAPPPRPQFPIALQDIRHRGVEGRLGLRLGTIIEVSGEVVPNTSDAKSDAGEPFFLRITAVEGRPLTSAVLYPFVKQNKSLHITPQIGDTFHLIGFETGRFGGSPDGEFKYVKPYASTRYQFVTSFVVLAAK